MKKGIRIWNLIEGPTHVDELIDKDVISDISQKFLDENLDVLFSNIYYTKKNDLNKIVRKWKSNLKEGVQ